MRHSLTIFATLLAASCNHQPPPPAAPEVCYVNPPPFAVGEINPFAGKDETGETRVMLTLEDAAKLVRYLRQIQWWIQEVRACPGLVMLPEGQLRQWHPHMAKVVIPSWAADMLGRRVTAAEQEGSERGEDWKIEWRQMEIEAEPATE